MFQYLFNKIHRNLVPQYFVMSRNVVSVLCLVGMIFYIAYCTSELYTRVNNIRKLERLNEYEKEVSEITRVLRQFKSDAKVVGEGVALLQEVITKMADATRQRSGSRNSRWSNLSLKEYRRIQHEEERMMFEVKQDVEQEEILDRPLSKEPNKDELQYDNSVSQYMRQRHDNRNRLHTFDTVPRNKKFNDIIKDSNVMHNSVR